MGLEGSEAAIAAPNEPFECERSSPSSDCSDGELGTPPGRLPGGWSPPACAAAVTSVAELPEGCSVRVAKGDHEAAGGSILGLMMLGAAKGDMIEIIVTGEDAEPVIENLAAMVEDGFGEP